MSGSEDNAGEKQHEPTQRKLEEARKRGDVPRSTDLNVAAAYGGLFLTCVAFGPAALNGAATPLPRCCPDRCPCPGRCSPAPTPPWAGR